MMEYKQNYYILLAWHKYLAVFIPPKLVFGRYFVGYDQSYSQLIYIDNTINYLQWCFIKVSLWHDKKTNCYIKYTGVGKGFSMYLPIIFPAELSQNDEGTITQSKSPGNMIQTNHHHLSSMTAMKYCI